MQRGESGVVLSGNGRSLAVRRAYAAGGAQAQRYRAYLDEQGFDTAGMARPFLIRVAPSDMTQADIEAFTREANERDNLAFSRPKPRRPPGDCTPRRAGR